MIRVDALDPFARAATTALGLDLLEAAALVALVLAAAAVSRSSATTRHVLWWIALAACAALPVASISSSFRHVEHRSVARSGAPAATVATIGSAPRRSDRERAARADAGAAKVTTPAASRDGAVLSEAPLEAFAGAPGGVVAVTLALLDRGWSMAASAVGLPYAASVLIAVWLAVASVGWTRLALSLVALGRIKRDALPLDDSVVRRLRRWRHSARTGRAVALAVSNDVDVPVAVGFRTPTILLPAAVVENQEIADIDQIAMHEYAHLERYDDWTNLLQRVIECGLWFNPIATSFIGRRISLEREVACDDWVIAQTGRAHRYATCLWKLVESSRLPASPIVAPGVLLSPKEITIRIERLLDSRRNALPRLSPAGTLGVGALTLAGAVLAAQHAPAVALTDVSAPAPVRTVTSDRGARAAAPHRLAGPAVKAVTATVVHVRISPPAPAKVVVSEPHTKIAFSEPHPKIVLDESLSLASPDAALPAPPAPPQRNAARVTLGAVDGLVSTVVSSSLRAVAQAGFGEAPATLDRASLQHCDGCDLHGRDLRGLDLHGIGLAGADLRGADFRGVNLAGANLAGDDLTGARFDDANLSGATLEGCELRGATFTGASLDGIHLAGTNVRGAIFKGAQLRAVVDRCEGCDLRGFDLRGLDLHGIRLDGTDLRGADLRNADLSGAHLTGVDLREAKLDGTNLRNAVLRGCSMRGTDRSHADTAGASFDASDDD